MECYEFIPDVRLTAQNSRICHEFILDARLTTRNSRRMYYEFISGVCLTTQNSSGVQEEKKGRSK